jgi:DNA-binding transcriptional MerR regulator
MRYYSRDAAFKALVLAASWRYELGYRLREYRNAVRVYDDDSPHARDVLRRRKAEVEDAKTRFSERLSLARDIRRSLETPLLP